MNGQVITGEVDIGSAFHTEQYQDQSSVNMVQSGRQCTQTQANMTF